MKIQAEHLLVNLALWGNEMASKNVHPPHPASRPWPWNWVLFHLWGGSAAWNGWQRTWLAGAREACSGIQLWGCWWMSWCVLWGWTPGCHASQQTHKLLIHWDWCLPPSCHHHLHHLCRDLWECFKTSKQNIMKITVSPTGTDTVMKSGKKWIDCTKFMVPQDFQSHGGKWK